MFSIAINVKISCGLFQRICSSTRMYDWRLIQLGLLQRSSTASIVVELSDNMGGSGLITISHFIHGNDKISVIQSI